MAPDSEKPRRPEGRLDAEVEELVALIRQPVRLREYRARFPYLMAGPSHPDLARLAAEVERSDLLPEQKLVLRNLEPRVWAIAHPGMGRRFLGFVIDLPVFLVFLVAVLAGIMTATEGSPEATQGMWALVGIVASYFVYFAASEWILGASPGGLVTGLRVVDPRGRRPGLGLCLKRQFIRIFRVLGAVLTAVLFSKSRNVNARMAGGAAAARIATPGGSEVVRW